MARDKRTLLEVHFHSHGDVQVGSRSIGAATESEGRGMLGRLTGSEEPERAEEPDGGGGASMLPLVVVGLVVAVAVARRLRGRDQEEPRQEALDEWVPGR